MRILLTILVLGSLSLSGCGNYTTNSYSYEAMRDVTFIVNTKKLKYYPNVNSVFLHFELIVENASNKDIYLDVGKIQASLNGVKSLATHYDSVASVMPHKEKLGKGRTSNNLYLVFSDKLRNQKLKEFNITSFGLSNI